MMAKKSLLPAGYTQYDWIGSETEIESYIDVGLLNDNRIARYKVYPTSKTSVTAMECYPSGWAFYYGIDNYYSNNKTRVLVGGSYIYLPDDGNPINRHYDILINLVEGIVLFEGSSYSTSKPSFGDKVHLWLATNQYFPVCEFISYNNDNTEKMHLIPCTDSNGIAGMYDIVNMTFLTNASGAGRLIVGNFE